MVEIIENEPLIDHVDEFDVVLIGTNCYQVMRNGFQNEIVRKYPHVREMNYSTKYGDIDKLGTILECPNEKSKTLFILLFISFGYNFKGNNDAFIDYDALSKCLKLINILHKRKRIGMTMIGCTEYDGNGDKKKVVDLINTYLKDVYVSVFDYKQESFNTMHQREFHNNIKNRRNKHD